MVATTKYLVIYHAVSAGQNGPNLGCDEEEIVMIVYLVLDVAQNKVIPVVTVTRPARAVTRWFGRCRGKTTGLHEWMTCGSSE